MGNGGSNPSPSVSRFWRDRGLLLAYGEEVKIPFRFEGLEIWKLACELSDKVSESTKKFPKSELFGLTPDLNRAGISIPSNIAEGSGSGSSKEFKRYLGIAVKSLCEVVSHLVIAKRRGYLGDQEFMKLYSDAEVLVKKIRSFDKTLK